MFGPEFVITIVAIGCATGLIKTWIEHRHGGIDEERFNRLAKAFMQHKSEMRRRLRNIETIIADERENAGPEASNPERYRQLEPGDPEEPGTLTNDLQRKHKVRT